VRPAAALALIALLALPAAADARTRKFRTPSGNIPCLYSSSGGPGPFLRCDVLSLNDVGFRVDRTRRARRIRVTDSVFDRRAPVLRYGRSLVLGPFRCTSRRTGLTCNSTVSGHGFRLSRERQRVY
jgi:hypothetical protein